MSEIDESRVRPLATKLKKLYYQFKGVNSRRHQSRSDDMATWERVSRSVMELEANPEDYIAAAFKYCTNSTGPFPNSLHGPTARKWYKQWCSIGVSKSRPTDLVDKPVPLPSQRELRQLVDVVRASMWNVNKHEELDQANIDLICSPHYGFNPLACMIVAGVAEDRVRELYVEDAMKFVDSRPDIRRAILELKIDPGFSI